MNKRLTFEEVKELEPNKDNPIIVTCDDGYFSNAIRTIKIVGHNNCDRIYVFNKYDDLLSLETRVLQHYPSLVQEPKAVTQVKSATEIKG